jgi:cytochrome c556
MKLQKLGLLALVCAGFAGPAAAQFQTTDSAIRYRQGAFNVLATHFARIAFMAQGITPFDAKAAAENAELVSSLAALPFTAFVPGSDKGVSNRSKADIWKDPAKFKAASDRMVGEAAKLSAAAKSGNFDLLKTASGSVAHACKACHDDFRGDRRE